MTYRVFIIMVRTIILASILNAMAKIVQISTSIISICTALWIVGCMFSSAILMDAVLDPSMKGFIPHTDIGQASRLAGDHPWLLALGVLFLGYSSFRGFHVTKKHLNWA